MVANKGGSAEYIKNTAKSNVANKELLFIHDLKPKYNKSTIKVQ